MMDEVLKDILLFVVLINPMSKVAVVSILSERFNRKDLNTLLFESNLFALVFLVVFAFAGPFILKDIFHLNIYSLRITGGIVLFTIGFDVLRKGIFFDLGANTKSKLLSLALVPLASPLIAGPATITAVIFESTLSNPLYVSAIVMFAIIINFSIMYFSPPFIEKLKKLDMIEALIKITGLFIAAIGTEMVLGGLSDYIGVILHNAA